MNREHLLAFLPVLLLTTLGLLLIWGVGMAVYLNRIHSRGWASVKRLLRSLAWMGLPALALAGLGLQWHLVSTATLAHLGRPEAEMELGHLYSIPDQLLAQDRAKGFRWLLKAANHGWVPAQVQAGQMLLEGQGTPADPAQALLWAERARNAGELDGVLLSGDCLAKLGRGEEAKMRYAEAVPALRLAVAAGNRSRMFQLGVLLSTGQGLPRDPVRGLAWMLLAQNGGLDPFQVMRAKNLERALSAAEKQEALVRARSWRPGLSEI